MPDELVQAGTKDVVPLPAAVTAAVAATGSASSSGSHAASSVECYYKHDWSHDGRKTSIRMKKAKPKHRLVCARCLRWLEQDYPDAFELYPCDEEMGE